MESFQAPDREGLLGLPAAPWGEADGREFWSSQAFASESCFLLINTVNTTFTFKNVWLISWHRAESLSFKFEPVEKQSMHI